MHKGIGLLLFFFLSTMALAQRPNVLQGISNRIGSLGNTGSGGGGDSLRSRAKAEESLTLTYYYADSLRVHKLDSSITDFTAYFPIPGTHIYLGNTGSATRSIVFAPQLKSGWDPGFHAFDVYKRKLETVPFYNTTKPYTELNYALASKGEQIIEVLHTQNLKPYWNASFNYRLISAPGTFRNQKANHNNYVFTSWYQAPSKRYNNYFVILANKLQAEESGGIVNNNDLNEPAFMLDRFSVPTNIGGRPIKTSGTFFNTTLYTGNRYSETNVMMRQQYDLGKKDSLVTDSTVIPLFYPRVRFEHTLNYGRYQYRFQDLVNAERNNVPDSAFYSRLNIHIDSAGRDTSLLYLDKWREISNDFSIYQFPDANNLQQFIKLGLELQLLKGELRTNRSLYNMIGHGEYRNRTRNQKWDIAAFGRLWLNGYNAGDYHAYISLQRLINPSIGSLQVGFENVNRTAPFIYNESSNFYLDGPKSFGKENTIHLFASVLQPKLRLRLNADYYLISNYLYLSDYYKLQQEGTLFNVLRISAYKTFNIGRFFRWHAEAYVQQKTGAAQLNFPSFYTRNRFGYEGKLGFRRLNIAIGTEIRYHTPYKADNYSPVLGQFFFQDSVTISNRPQIDAYLHFRIRSFKAFLRAENLNTMSLQNGFGFTHNNFAAPGYPTPGLIIRFGIFWSFVN